MGQHSSSPARGAYDEMAVFYDAFSSHHDYELWLRHLLPALEEFGLSGRRLLDVGCGTGKSFEPLLDTDWQITGCDLSAAMLRQAEIRAQGQVHLEAADMRDLPAFGEFDLVWALGDVVNYVLDPEELEQCLVGFRRNLAPRGLLLFDVNTVLSHRTLYGETSIKSEGDHRLIWRGQAAPDAPPGGEVQAIFEVQDPEGATVCRAVHRQRHYPPRTIEAALERAGLKTLAVFGHGFDARLEQPTDEARHTKAVFIARQAQ